MSQSRVVRFLEAEVKCYYCGKLAGLLSQEDSPARGWPVFLSSEGRLTAPVTNLAALRCRYCQGPLYAEEMETVSRYIRGTQPFERPRRGRPPKRLLERASS
jgi:hypothetical protein